MSAELLSQHGGQQPGRPRQPGRLRAVTGTLDDGTPYYAPLGEVITDGILVTCHLCGRGLRSATAHLRSHGWTKPAYCEAFGLERGQSLEGQETRKLRAAALASRLLFEPAMRAGSKAGRQRARTGMLARDAARAAAGRQFPAQRRRKARQARAAIPAAVIARASRNRADQHLQHVAAAAAARQGYPDIGSFVLARVREGASLTTISRAAGLHKDWLSRHLARLDPAAAALAQDARPARWDRSWMPRLRELGFGDVAGYLRDRHIEKHQTTSAIAAEVGLSHHAVAAALRRHGLARTSHAAKRHSASRRAAAVAAGLGFGSIEQYVADRRAAGLTWRAMAEESGQPMSWLRRHGVPGEPGS